MTDDETLSQSSDPTTVPADPVCSTCGYPLHVFNSGPTGEVTADGITWRSNLICTNSNYNGTGLPCAQNGTVQQTSDSVIPILKE
jgi:hypothetical protein